MPTGLTPGAAVGAALDRGAGAHRDLPWRRTRDPWAVLVSEVVLQHRAARVAAALVADRPAGWAGDDLVRP